jgi:hypothetical protein
MAAFSDTRPWRRYLDDFSIVPEPRRRFYPVSLAELVEIVREAEHASLPAGAVRAVGRHWAPCECAVNRDGIFVETHSMDPVPGQPQLALNKMLFNVIGKSGCLTDAALRFFREQGVAPFRADDASELTGANPADDLPDVGFKKFFLAHFESGTRVCEAYDRLDRGFDAEADSLCALPEFSSYKGPWAIPTLGGSGGQTVVGATATGTHGGDVFMPPIADAIQAVHLVGPGGKQYWFERPLPGGVILTLDAKLKQRFPGITIKREPDFVDAAMVSVGRLGIIYSVVIRVVRQYALRQSTKEEPELWRDVAPRLRNVRRDFKKSRFLQVVVNPHGNPGAKDDHLCFLTVRNTRPLAEAIPPGQSQPAGRAERTGPKTGASESYKSDCFMNLICRHADDDSLEHWFDPLVDAIKHALFVIKARFALAASANPLVAALIFLGTESALKEAAEILRDAGILKDEADAFLGALEAVDIVDDVLDDRDGKTIGGLIAELCNKFVAAGRNEYVRFLNKIFIGSGGRPEDMTAISYAVMDGHNYLDRGCTTRGVSLEAFVDGDSTLPAEIADAVFTRVNQLMEGTLPRAGGQKLAFAGYLSLRYMSRSSGLIAMQQNDVVCSLELSGLGGCTGNSVFMEEIAEFVREKGGRLHWGQFNENLDVNAIEAQYGARLDRWRDVLSFVSENGRLPTFQTPFTVRKGLEVVKPVIGKFMVAPRNGVAGEEGSIFWDAVKNPLGTTARLVMTPVGGPPVVTTLGPLNGTQKFTVPKGLTDFELILEHVFNGKPYLATQKTRVRGYHAEDPIWIHVGIAGRIEVDGRMQYAARLAFSGGEWSVNLRVDEVLFDFTGAPPGARWTMRGPGTTERVFNAERPLQALTDRPFLAGAAGAEWVFIHRIAGEPAGAGAPPPLNFRFRFGHDPLPVP